MQNEILLDSRNGNCFSKGSLLAPNTQAAAQTIARRLVEEKMLICLVMLPILWPDAVSDRHPSCMMMLVHVSTTRKEQEVARERCNQYWYHTVLPVVTAGMVPITYLLLMMFSYRLLRMKVYLQRKRGAMMKTMMFYYLLLLSAVADEEFRSFESRTSL